MGWVFFVYQAYPSKWKDTVIWIQLHWFENSSGPGVAGCSFSLMIGNTRLESLMMYTSRRPVDFAVQLIFYSIPPSSLPSHCLANSHFAGIMKLMFYGPLLAYDKMDEKREGRRREKQKVSQMEGKKKRQTIQGLVPCCFSSVNSSQSITREWALVRIL